MKFTDSILMQAADDTSPQLSSTSAPKSSHRRYFSSPKCLQSVSTLPPKTPVVTKKKTLDHSRSFSPLQTFSQSGSPLPPLPSPPSNAARKNGHRRCFSTPILTQPEKPNDKHKRFPSLPTGSAGLSSIKSHRRILSPFKVSLMDSPPAPLSSSSSDIATNELDDLLCELEERKLSENEMDTSTPALYNRIGNIYFRRGEYKHASESYGAALITYRTVLETEEHPFVATTLGNLGTLRWKMGMLKEAKNYLQRALEIQARVFGSDEHVQVANALHNVGIVNLLRGDHDAALEMLTRALYARREILGREHVDVSRSIDAMGSVYTLKDDLERAMLCHEEALRIKHVALGKYHPSTVVTIMNIAKVHRRSGRLDEAIDAFQGALKVQRGNYALPMDPIVMMDVGLTLHMLGDIYRLKGEYLDAMNVFSEALRAYAKAGLHDDNYRIISLNESMSKAENVILGDYPIAI